MSPKQIKRQNDIIINNRPSQAQWCMTIIQVIPEDSGFEISLVYTARTSQEYCLECCSFSIYKALSSNPTILEPQNKTVG
jgi:hypothetical protein